jgi:hypothetical protein
MKYGKTAPDSRNIRIILMLIASMWPVFNVWAGSQDMNPNTLKLKIDGNGYSDETIVYFIPQATTGFDPGYDAYKMMGILAAPQFYSIIDCCKLSINALPEIYNAMTVRLGFRVGVNTNYTITATGLFTFGADTAVFLEDTKMNEFIHLKTDSVYTFFGETTDQEERFRIHFYCPMKFDLQVMLEGPFNGALMSNELNNQDLLPLNHPYDDLPWDYQGNESVFIIPNNSIVDWILVELRDAANVLAADASTITGRHACFLMSNGSIRGLDGENLPLFQEVFTDGVFIVIRHRNHLDVMSSFPLQRNGGTYHFDFTTGPGQAFGNLPLAELGNNLFGLYAGDANADGNIDPGDKINSWSSMAGNSGYEPADMNLDGHVGNPDKNDLWYRNSGRMIQIP